MVARKIRRVFILWYGTPGFGLESVRIDNFRSREQRASGLVALRGARLLHRLHNVGHADGMNFIPGLERFLLKVEENLGEPWLLFSQRKNSLIHHLQAKSGLHTFTVRVRHTEADVRIIAGLVDSGIGHRFDLEFISRLHKDQTMIAGRTSVPSKLVGVEVECARHVWG